MPVLHSEEQLLRSESLSLKSLVPEYGIGDCYPASVMGWSRWLDALLEGDDPERYWRAFDQLTYCQGWYLRRWSDGAIDGFPHGFLIDTTAAADDHQRYCERVGYELPQKLWATRQFRTLIQEAIK